MPGGGDDLVVERVALLGTAQRDARDPALALDPPALLDPDEAAALLAADIPDLLLDGFKLIAHLAPSPTIGMR